MQIGWSQEGKAVIEKKVPDNKNCGRVIIFAIFLYKGRIRQPNVYKQLVHIFVIKKLGKKINLEINTGDYISTEDARDLILDELLNDKVSDYLKTVKIKFIFWSVINLANLP